MSVQNYISFHNAHIEDFYSIKKVIEKKSTTSVFRAVKKDNGKIRALKEIKVKSNAFLK